MLRYEFASDNTAGATPEVMDALVAANRGFSAAYGGDDLSARAADLIREFLDCDCEIHFVATGTAANAISLAAVCRPFESVLAHEHAHVIIDEAGAPSFFGHGLRLIGLAGESGRINPASLEHALRSPESPNRQSPAALAISNSTEYGAVYSTSAVQELTRRARESGLATYLDGSRLANAVASGFDAQEIKNLGIDLALVGGTKSGMSPTEAIVIFDKRLGKRITSRLKQSGQLPSKGRFFAAPWIAMLEAESWIERARHANLMAQKLAAVMPFAIAHPVETNLVFVLMDRCHQQRLRELGWVAFRMADDTVRFATSWATTHHDISELAAALRLLS